MGGRTDDGSRTGGSRRPWRGRPRKRTVWFVGGGVGIVAVVLAIVFSSLGSPPGATPGVIALDAAGGQLSGGATPVSDPSAAGGKAVAFSDTPASAAGGSATSGTGAAAPSQGFLSRQGTSLTLDGAPFRFTGLDVYNAASTNNCWYDMASGSTLADSLTDIGGETGGKADVIRVWFFQNMATLGGQRDWAPFDQVLAAARAHGFLVIPVLANQWGTCDGSGGYKTESWYQSGYRQTQAGALESYRDWVRDVVTRYHSDPTVAMWMLMNEAEDAQSQGGTCSSTSTSTLRSFTDDMASVVKAADGTHLLTLGTIGGGQCGTAGAAYQTVYASPDIDVCEYHDYNSPTAALPGDVFNGLQTRINQCRALGKPIITGEAGIDPTQVGGTGARASLFDAKITAQLGAGIDGFLAWEWRAGGQTGGDQYVIAPGDPTLAVLGSHSMALPTQGTPPTASSAADVAPTPPMGWNHYNHFGNAVNEQLIEREADAMVANGMKGAGYVYVNVDDSWQGGRDAAGNIYPNSSFPDMAALGAYLHARGLKFGIYTTPNTISCNNHVGSAGHEAQDAKTFAAWGVDYIKLDWCKADYSPQGAAAIAQKWSQAIAATGRPMVLSINAGQATTVAPWASKVATMWRTTDDICASWFNKTAPHSPTAQDCFDSTHHDGLYDIIGSGTAMSAPYVGPGHWADPDMLEVGQPGMTFAEEQAEFSLWSMWSAPLIAGNDPAAMNGSDDASKILLNSEVIAIDQDSLGVMATRVSDVNGLQVWTKPLADGDTAVLLLNTTAQPTNISVSLATLGLTGSHAVRDLWSHTDLGTFSGTITAENVATHGSALLRIGPATTTPSATPTGTVGHGPASTPTYGADTLQLHVAATATYRLWVHTAIPAGDADAVQATFGGSGSPLLLGTAVTDSSPAGSPPAGSSPADISPADISPADTAPPTVSASPGPSGGPPGAWTWNGTIAGTASPVTVHLAAGTTTLTLTALQPGVWIDRVILTPDTGSGAGCVPTGTGTDCVTPTSGG